jgi:signal transduction histidine kinase
VAKSEREKSLSDSFNAGRFDELRDMDTDLFEAGVWSSSKAVVEKEGLPARYTMRHDTHYVDELVSGKAVRQIICLPVKDISTTWDDTWQVGPLADSIAEFGMLQPLIVRRRHSRYELLAGAKRLAAAKAAGLTEVPCLLYDVDDRRAERLREATNLRVGDPETDETTDSRTLLRSVLPLLSQSLQTTISCLNHVSDKGGSLRDRVTGDLIYSEAQRASRLTWGAVLLSFTPSPVLSVFDTADVLKDVLDALSNEHILAELRLEKSIQRPCMLRADRRLLSVAIRGVVDAILPLARTRRSAPIAVRLARNEPARAVVFEVAQDVLRPPDSDWSRWFDLGWRERPGGIASGVGLLAAKRVTELHGGRLSVTPRRGRGCLITLWFPQRATSTQAFSADRSPVKR